MSGAPRHSPGRRRFVQLVGWASVLASGGGPALAQMAAKRAKAAAPAPSPSPSPSPSEFAAEARALGEVVRERYGDHLGPDELAAVVKDLESDLGAVKRLREVKLSNSDEPDTIFRA